MTTTLRKTSLLSLGAALLLSAAITAPAQARGGASDIRYERELLRQESTSQAETQPQADQSVRQNGNFSDVLEFEAGQDDDDWMFPGDHTRGR